LSHNNCAGGVFRPFDYNFEMSISTIYYNFGCFWAVLLREAELTRCEQKIRELTASTDAKIDKYVPRAFDLQEVVDILKSQGFLGWLALVTYCD